MENFSINLLGEIRIRLNCEPVTQFRSQKEIALLAYLAHSGQAHNREMLADMLWDASSTAQSLSNLRTVIARLRKQVGDHLIVTRHTLAVTPVVHQHTDSARFQALLAGVGAESSNAAIHQLAEGVDLFAGEFMAGFSLPNAPRFDDWLAVEREHLRRIALSGFRQLAAWQSESGDYPAGALTARRWLALDALDESAHQQLMRLLAYDGRVSEALGVYHKCRELLWEELAISPAPATTALYESIQDGALSAPKKTPARLHNLPRALTPLFGRKEEIARLNAYLLDPAYPLVSITGIGGIGKTSLTLAAARRLISGAQIQTEHHLPAGHSAEREQPPFPDGVWFVSLEGVENCTPAEVREEVAALIGGATGAYFHNKSELWPQLLAQLASKNLLLILDNIEQFLPIAVDLIVDLLGAGEQIQLLTTSRAELPLGAALSFPLTGLETPSRVSAETLHNESVRLFAERAARSPAPFHLEKHLAEVAAICQFVEGMPLGIELAAASLGRLMVSEILPALNGNLQLLSTTRQDLPPRQRTFRAVFDYTWQLLEGREQTVLAQLSVFRGGFTRQAAEAVLADAAAGLYNLQRFALLRRDETGRFGMHSLVRQLASEKLGDGAMTEIAVQTLNRHSAYFSDFVCTFEKELQTGVAEQALETISAEQPNLRAAWQHAVQTGLWQLIGNCLDGLHHFYRRKGYFSEEALLVDGAIAALQAAMTAESPSLGVLLSRLLTVRARDYLYASRFEDGTKVAERACELAQRFEDAGVEAQARLALAKNLSMLRMHTPSLEQYQQVVTLAKSAQNPIFEADAWIGIGEQSAWVREHDLSDEALQKAYELSRAYQYKPGEMETLNLLGRQADRRGAPSESVQFYRQALQLSRQLGNVIAEAIMLGSLGVGLTSLGDIYASLAPFQKALDTFRRLNMTESLEWILGQLGYSALKLGDYAAADKYLSEALAIASELKDAFWEAWIKLRLGNICCEQGELEQALSLITQAYQTVEPLQQIPLQARILYDWGLALLGYERWAQAGKKFQEAYDLWHGLGRTENALLALAGLAYAAYRQELPAIAAEHAEQIWQTWQEQPALAERADLIVYWLLGMVWQGLGDGRSGALQNKARALLHTRSEKIPDEIIRRMYLEKIPAHRAILDNLFDA